jgi:stage V sporulation protein R
MAVAYEVEELEAWDSRIRAKRDEFGLSSVPQEFELCDHNQMLACMAYTGMPSHYPHWSFGKAYEKLKTLYDYGVSGLPYEMVINSNPAVAYLMRDNTLLLQVLTIAHVYAHTDFFKHNFMFMSTRPELVVGSFKAHADRVRSYVGDPTIGAEEVERVLDAAHALSLQCRRNPMLRKRTREEEEELVLEASRVTRDSRRSDGTWSQVEPELRKVPLVPDEDLLLFIRDHNPHLADWEKDLLTIVHEEAQYFIPQFETKIMNEGWATYWHKRILDSLSLPEALRLEFIVRHNQVIRPIPGGLNPYFIGLRVWEDIYRRCEEPPGEEAEEVVQPQLSGQEKLFEVRESDRDVSFLRRHLTEELVTELKLFEYEARGEDLVVSKVADKSNWREVKESLLKNVGMNGIPVIKVQDSDFGRNRTLYLAHEHDGRDLQLESAQRTLACVMSLWQRDVVLETILNGERYLLLSGDNGFSMRRLQ